MEFVYSYKTSDGVRHEAAIEASSRDEAFAELRQRGIRPIRVTPVGGEANGRRRYGGRANALAAGLAALLVGAGTWLAAMRFAERPWMIGRERPLAGQAEDGSGMAAVARPRGQIEGYGAIDLGKTFLFASERRLAAYARPGVAVAPDAELDGLADLPEALDRPLAIAPGDSPSVRELKRMVTGLKDEARAYIRAGHGTAAFAEWLTARQRMEADYRRQMSARVKSGLVSREEANATLRAMSFPEIE